MSDTEAQRAAALTVLGLAAGATPAEVTSAYRRLARATHPDHSTHDDAGARFALLAEAYRRARQIGEASEPEPAVPEPPGPDATSAGGRAAGGTAAAARPGRAAATPRPLLVVGPVHVTPTERSTFATRHVAADPRTRQRSSWLWWDVWEEGR